LKGRKRAMKTAKSIIISAMLIIGFLGLSVNESNAWPRYRFYKAPVVNISKPGPKHIWVEGHWKINKFGKKVWVPGHWKRV